MKFNVINYLYRSIEENPTGIFIKNLPHIVTYEEFDRKLSTVYSHISDYIRGNVIALAFDKTNIELFICIALCWREGKTIVPIKKSWSQDRINSILASSGASVIFSDVELEFLSDIRIDRCTDEIYCHSMLKQNPKTFDTNDEIAYILYTSGTTGKPKGVPIRHLSLRSYVENIVKIIPIPSGENCFSNIFEPTFDLFYHDLLIAWYHQSSLAPINPDNMFSIPKKINENNITCWFSVPSLIPILQCVCSDSSLYTSIHLSLFCGEPLTVESARAWGTLTNTDTVFNLYGPTEATIACFAYQHFIDCQDVGLVKIGNPIGETEPYLLKKDSDYSELLICGPQLFNGYIDERNSKFVDIDGKKYYKTGDLVSRDIDGYLEFKGRIDRQVKILGNRIELDLIESELRSKNNLYQLFIKPYTSGSEQMYSGIEVYYVSDKPERITSEGCNYAQDLPIKKICRLDEISRNSNGKVDYNELR